MENQKASIKQFFNQPQELSKISKQMERELQIVKLANSEVKRRGYDESHEEFGEMVEGLVYRIHRALFDPKKFQNVINKWRKN